MYAIIKTGGKQYQVQPEVVIQVNRLALEQGSGFETDQVLLLDEEGAAVRIGTPLVDGAVVKGTVLEHLRGRKVLIFKHKRRKNYRRTRGHRQELTRVRIDTIEMGGKLIAGAKPTAKPAKPKAPPREAAEASSTGKPAADAATGGKAAKGKAKAAPKAAGKAAAKAGAKPAAKKPAAKAGAKAPAKKPAAKAGGTRSAGKSGGKSGGKGAGKKK